MSRPSNCQSSFDHSNSQALKPARYDVLVQGPGSAVSARVKPKMKVQVKDAVATTSSEDTGGRGAAESNRGGAHLSMIMRGHAEKLRREANASLEPPSPPSSSHHEEPKLDYEKAFIELVRAATLVMERIPEHRDFEKVLSEVQRENLKLVNVFVCVVQRGRGADGMQNGLSMMTRMGEIKPLLMQRIVAWDQAHGVLQQQGQREAAREKERE
ncbi:hypothetical protein DXG01_014324 [Tephrocybe rancida]|nr:hypothetical protein DXG01_014324 [Tephrocybe rancida]